MTLIAYDSTNPADNPPGGDLYFGYSDGIYANMTRLRALFPDKPCLEISAVGRTYVDFGDCEPGCIWGTATMFQWIMAARAAGIANPLAYVGRSNWAALCREFTSRGIPEPDYWVAHYLVDVNGSPIAHLCSSSCYRGADSDVGARVAIGTQIGGDQVGHYDISVFQDRVLDVLGGLSPEGGGTPIEEDELNQEEHDALMQASQQMNLFFGAFGGQVRDPLARVARPFRMFQNNDQPGDPEYTVLAYPGMEPWHVPSLDFVNLLEATISSPRQPLAGNEFQFVMDRYAAIGASGAASAVDLTPALNRLDTLLTAVSALPKDPITGASVDLQPVRDDIAAVDAKLDGVAETTSASVLDKLKTWWGRP